MDRVDRLGRMVGKLLGQKGFGYKVGISGVSLLTVLSQIAQFLVGHTHNVGNSYLPVKFIENIADKPHVLLHHDIAVNEARARRKSNASMSSGSVASRPQ